MLEGGGDGMSDQIPDQSTDRYRDQTSDSAIGSYGRTDVLTYLQDKSSDLTLGDARAHTAIDGRLESWIADYDGQAADVLAWLDEHGHLVRRIGGDHAEASR